MTNCLNKMFLLFKSREYRTLDLSNVEPSLSIQKKKNHRICISQSRWNLNWIGLVRLLTGPTFDVRSKNKATIRTERVRACISCRHAVFATSSSLHRLVGCGDVYLHEVCMDWIPLPHHPIARDVLRVVALGLLAPRHNGS